MLMKFRLMMVLMVMKMIFWLKMIMIMMTTMMIMMMIITDNDIDDNGDKLRQASTKQCSFVNNFDDYHDSDYDDDDN